jgi:diguanylate cyclase (GGDEF)-like protein
MTSVGSTQKKSRRKSAKRRAADIQFSPDKYRAAPGAAASEKKQIKRLSGLFEIALNNMARGLSMFDHEQRLVVCNPLYQEIFELPKELTEAGTPFADIIAYHVWKETGHSTEDNRACQQRWIDAHVAALSGGKSFSETKYLRNGRVILVSNQPLPEGGWVDIQEDITEKNRAENRIAWLSRHDTLTELYNRYHFREELQSLLASGREFAVLWIDLDGFKRINDTLGQPVGDALLKTVAKRLRGATRRSDVLARLGGDEFALIRFGATSREKSEHVANRLLRVMNREHSVLGQKIRVSASVGIALAPAHGGTPDELLKNADLALYSAKTSGGGMHAFFDPASNYGIGRSHDLEADLKLALKKKQFELHYQPIVDLRSQSVGGFEALIRWRHPERGLIPPGDFIPFAEQSALIVEIGQWALQRACRDAMTWPKDIKVTVNLSSIQFEKGDLYKTVAESISASGLAPGRLELEVTESVLLRDHPDTREILHRIRSLGVKISLDDFGTAYASLSYLRSFPFDKLKIDRSFVKDFGTAQGRDCVAIVQSVTGLAKRLGMVTVVEGIETLDQFNMVSSAGCEEVQGFYFGRPVPLDEIGAALARCRRLFSPPSLVQTA